ncbi:MAG: response regulator transcription factor [Clostridia bacterium]|nr:response regulator transcription factor [Clostridia bacterium]
MKIKVEILMIEDHIVVRNGLKFFLESYPKFHVCSEAGSIKEALSQTGSIKPDLILLDLKLPDNEGVNGFRLIQNAYPDTPIIILTAYIDRFTLKELIRMGLKGCYLKNIESDGLISGIDRIVKGEYAIDPSIANEVFHMIHHPDSNIYDLKEKEINILELICEGKLNKEIASELNASEKTIRNTISQIFKKINVTNRTEAAAFWLKRYN